jgi:hypothetical protein
MLFMARILVVATNTVKRNTFTFFGGLRRSRGEERTERPVPGQDADEREGNGRLARSAGLHGVGGGNAEEPGLLAIDDLELGQPVSR